MFQPSKRKENSSAISQKERGVVQPGHLVWLVYGLIISFSASYIFADLLRLPVDLYYLIYFASIAGFFALYIRQTALDLKHWLLMRLWWAMLAGLIVGALMVQNVLSRPATEQFTGTYLVWMIIWRGVIYGAVDGMLLYAFPWLVTWRAFDVRSKPLFKKIAFSALALLFIMFMTTAYHLGYRDFRSKKILQPNIGSTIMSIPTLVTANPLASPITHVIMHVAAVVHSPNTDLFLPPHREE
jgi:hypothetical protein